VGTAVTRLQPFALPHKPGIVCEPRKKNVVGATAGMQPGAA
jgi:hypothetical protein